MSALLASMESHLHEIEASSGEQTELLASEARALGDDLEAATRETRQLANRLEAKEAAHEETKARLKATSQVGPSVFAEMLGPCSSKGR